MEIKPKTKITMKPNSIKSKVRHRRTICNLTSDICLLTSFRYRLHFHQKKDSNADYPYMRNEPNFQKSRLSVTLAMIRTYNDNCPKKHKKSKPNPNPIRTQSKPKPNPIQTRSKPKPNPISRGISGILLSVPEIQACNV